jgi:hypothetical protein
MRTPSAVVSRTIASATARASSGRASAASTTPGRPFFICTGVERARGERPRGGVGHELAGGVVEVRLDHDHVAAAGRGGLGELADEHAHDIRHLRQIPRAGAVADVLERHRGHGAVALDGRREDRRGRRRDELRADVEWHERRAAEQLERGRRGQRQPPVRGVDEAA